MSINSAILVVYLNYMDLKGDILEIENSALLSILLLDRIQQVFQHFTPLWLSLGTWIYGAEW